MRTEVLAPAGSGPCVKQTVTATLVAKDGTRYVGTNHCMKPQTVCPRAKYATGVGYHLCKCICEQPAHAEENALRIAGAEAVGAVLYVEGHTYACESCTNAAADAGVAQLVIGSPP